MSKPCHNKCYGKKRCLVTGAYVDSDYNLQPQKQVKVVVQEAAKPSRAQRKKKNARRINADILAVAQRNDPASKAAPAKKVKVYGKTPPPVTSTTGDEETQLPNQRPHAVKHFKVLRAKRAEHHAAASKSISMPGQRIRDVLKKSASHMSDIVKQGVKDVKSTYAASKAANSTDSYSPKSDKSWSSKTSTPETRKAAAPAPTPAEQPKETISPRNVSDSPRKKAYDRSVARKTAKAADPNSKSQGRNRGGKRAQGPAPLSAKKESFKIIRSAEEELE